MKSIFHAENNKGGVITNIFAEITKRKSHLIGRRLSEEERKAMCEKTYAEKVAEQLKKQELTKTKPAKDIINPGVFVLGAVIGDVAGSIYEFSSMKSKDFQFWGEHHRITDDSVLSCIIYKVLSDYKRGVISKENLNSELIKTVKTEAKKYPSAGYGGGFLHWLYSDDDKPYNSYGNGSAMRCSAAGILAGSEEEAIWLAEETARITHNHPEGIKGAVATALAIYLALHGASKEEIRNKCSQYYNIPTDVDTLRENYVLNCICQATVPEAIICFLDSTNFEDAIRNAVSLGGDSDTLGAIAGSIAGAYYGIPADMQKKAIDKLDKNLRQMLGLRK